MSSREAWATPTQHSPSWHDVSSCEAWATPTQHSPSWHDVSSCEACAAPTQHSPSWHDDDCPMRHYYTSKTSPGGAHDAEHPTSSSGDAHDAAGPAPSSPERGAAIATAVRPPLYLPSPADGDALLAHEREWTGQYENLTSTEVHRDAAATYAALLCANGSDVDVGGGSA